MTARDGTPLPWGGRDRADMPFAADLTDNPLDQLCDALRIRRPKGVERIRAMDAFGRLMQVWNEAWHLGAAMSINDRPQPDDPGPAGHVGG